jgi:hypothetical protein
MLEVEMLPFIYFGIPPAYIPLDQGAGLMKAPRWFQKV